MESLLFGLSMCGEQAKDLHQLILSCSSALELQLAHYCEANLVQNEEGQPVYHYSESQLVSAILALVACSIEKAA